jgi:hypothetical protein
LLDSGKDLRFKQRFMNIKDFTFLINNKRDDTFFGHLKSFFLRDTLSGTFDGETITLWSSSWQSGVFHPVFDMKKVNGTSEAKLKITHRINIAGKILGLGIVFGFWTPFIMVLTTIRLNDIIGLIPGLILCAVFGLIPIVIHKVIYPREVERQEQFIKDLINEYLEQLN